MEYTLTVHERKDHFIRVTIGEMTYHLIDGDENGKWDVCDFDEIPVSDGRAKFVKNLLKAWRIIK